MVNFDHRKGKEGVNMKNYQYRVMDNMESIDGVDIYCFDDDHFYKYVKGEYKPDGERKSNHLRREPFLSIRGASDLLQALLDAGVKSPDKSFNEGKLAATEIHLKDMKTILYKKMGIDVEL